jgi:hypothetical protein
MEAVSYKLDLVTLSIIGMFLLFIDSRLAPRVLEIMLNSCGGCELSDDMVLTADILVTLISMFDEDKVILLYPELEFKLFIAIVFT